MKLILSKLKSFKNYRYFLLSIIILLSIIQVGAVLKRIEEPGNNNLLATSLLSWGTILLLFQRKIIKFKFIENGFSIILGSLTLILLLSVGTLFQDSVIFLRLFPLVAALVITALASPGEQVKQCWQEFIVLGILSIPETFAKILVGLPLVTAKFSSLILSILGFNVVQKGVYIWLPTGGVEVIYGCSGANQMFHLLRIAILFLVLFPTKITQNNWVRLGVCSLAVTIGFVVNSLRVSWLAFLVSTANRNGFKYWHTGEGALLFSITAILIFGLFCYFMLLKDEPEQIDSVEQESQG